MKIIYDENANTPWRVIDKHGRQAYMRDDTANGLYKPMIPLTGTTEGEIVAMLLVYAGRMQEAFNEIEEIVSDAVLRQSDTNARAAMRRVATISRHAADGLYSGREPG